MTITIRPTTKVTGIQKEWIEEATATVNGFADAGWGEQTIKQHLDRIKRYADRGGFRIEIERG